MGTRTHTVFFKEDDLASLDTAIAEIEASIDHRRPHIGAEIVAAVDHRISLLRSARALLAEPVSEALY